MTFRNSIISLLVALAPSVAAAGPAEPGQSSSSGETRSVIPAGCDLFIPALAEKVQTIFNSSANAKAQCIELNNDREVLFDGCAENADGAFAEAWANLKALCAPAVGDDWEGVNKFSTSKPDAEVIGEAKKACSIPKQFADPALLEAIASYNLEAIQAYVAKVNETLDPKMQFIIHRTSGGSGGDGEDRIQFIFQNPEPKPEGSTVYLQMGWNPNAQLPINVSIICDFPDGAYFRDTEIVGDEYGLTMDEPKVPTSVGANDCTNCHVNGRPLGVHGEEQKGGTIGKDKLNEILGKFEKDGNKSGRKPLLPDATGWGIDPGSDEDLRQCAKSGGLVLTAIDCSFCHDGVKRNMLLDTSGNAVKAVLEGWMPPPNGVPVEQRPLLADLMRADRARKICAQLKVSLNNCPGAELPARCSQAKPDPNLQSDMKLKADRK